MSAHIFAIMKVLNPWDAIVYAYFLSHIPATLLIDAQALSVPVGAWHPAFARNALKAYCETLADPLMCSSTPASWFVAIIAVEVALQLPFFFVVLQFWSLRPRWLRLGLMVYSAHVATTLVPIYGELLGALCAGALTGTQAAALSAIYSPYLLVPLALLIDALRQELAISDSRAAAVTSTLQVSPRISRGRSSSRGPSGARVTSAGRMPASARAASAGRTPKIKVL